MRYELIFDEETHKYFLNGEEVPSVTQICSPLTANKYGAGQAIIQMAARRGTAVHEYCELIDYGAMPEEVEPELVGYITAYQKFLRDYRPEWHYIEKQLADTQLKFAGTLDRMGVIDGKRTIVDIKTTASMDRASKISLAVQMAGYGILAISNDMGEVEQSLGVQLKKDGGYTIHDTKKTEKLYHFDSTLTFLDLHRLQKLIGG